MKRAAFFLAVLLAVLSLASCEREVDARHCELGIILPAGFEKMEAPESFDLCYSDGTLTVGISRMSYASALEEEIPDSLTARSFAALYSTRSGRTDARISDYGDAVYYTYVDKADDGRLIRYTPTFYKTPYAYFILTFIAESSAVTLEETLCHTANVYLELG